MMPLYRKLTTLCYAAVLAFGLAACGGGGTETAEAPPAPDPALGVAQMAAAAAATAADTAADAAEGAVMAQAANAAADLASHGIAGNAAMRARAAATAAQGASGAAAATDDTAAAEAQQAIAEAKQGEAETEQGNAEMYAGMVAVAHQANLDEIQRVMDVADARVAAMGSYMAADTDAKKAQMQADDAETTAPGSPGAMTAQVAATAARTAANAAMAAHGAIMDDMTKTQADAQAAKAATQAGHANAGYMTAMAENDDIQTTGSQIAENNRQNAIGGARRYGGQAADNAMQSATEARTAANAAKDAYDDAKAAYEKAKRARTNSEDAKKYADEAHTAYTAANSAANDANAAYMAAKNAVAGVMDDSSLDDANTARDTAEAQETIAMGHMTTAMTKQTEAEGAEMKATMYGDDHVLGVFVLANAGHIRSAGDDTSTHTKQISEEIALAAKSVGNSQAETTVNVVWPYKDNDTGPGEGKPTITVNIGRVDYAMMHAGPGADGKVGTDDDAKDNFTIEPALGDFTHVKDISVTTTDDNKTPPVVEMRTRILVFTDKEQANAPADVQKAGVTNARVSVSQVIEDVSPKGIPKGIEKARFDHDNNPDTLPMMGLFSCGGEEPTCSIATSGGRVTAISGYTFSSSPKDGEGDGSEVIIVDAKLSVEDKSWLAFGVWIQDDAGQAILGNRYEFGAFAAGVAIAESTPDTPLEGKATYEGSAAGVRSTASRNDFFSGDATLTANFGDETGKATLSGKIQNIVAGGDLVSHDIYLDAKAGNVTKGNVKASRARMGAQTTGTGGDVTYPMEGTWDAQFYNPAMDDMATMDVVESVDNTAPGSVAGTFGVTRADVEDTEDVNELTSFVGAFGAHKQ